MGAIETFGMIIQFVSLSNRPPRTQLKILPPLIKMAALNPLQASCISKALVHISNALGDIASILLPPSDEYCVIGRKNNVPHQLTKESKENLFLHQWAEGFGFPVADVNTPPYCQLRSWSSS